MLEDIIGALDLVFAWENFFWAFIGVLCGAIMGSIPGLTDTMAIVLLLPFTYYLGPIPGIAMLMGLSKGGNFGGSLPAILFNIPGTPQAMCTTFDGYPLARQGKSGKAMQTALYSEYSMVVLFSLVVISVAATADPLRGLLSTALGLFLATVGTDPEFGTMRLTFGIVDLADGFSLMPMVIGLLAFSEVLLQAENYFRQRLAQRKSGEQEEKIIISSNPDDNRVTAKEFKTCLPTIGRSTFIGSIIGIVPGIGTTVGAYLSYLWARKKSKTPELFGKGALEGIAASEAGNNAVNGPNLVPLVTLGIPGNLAAALIMGGFMIKGLVPGPRFMEDHASLLYALFAVLLISNFFTLLIGSVFIRYVRRLTNIPRSTLYACILVFSILGAYVFNGNMFDVWVMFWFGIIGYLLNKMSLNLPTLIVAFFLGQLLEEKIRQTLLISGNDWTVFFTRPFALFFIVLTILTSYIYLSKIKKAAKNISD